MDSLLGSVFYGDTVPIAFNVDSSADDETLQMVQVMLRPDLRHQKLCVGAYWTCTPMCI
jgi:hypothetical protein